jgi:outer membrane biosynthesis protein TonB
MELSNNTTPYYSLSTLGQALLIEILLLGLAYITFTGIFKENNPPQDVSINLVMNEEQKAIKPPEPPKPKVVPVVKPNVPKVVQSQDTPVTNQPADNLVKETVSANVSSRNESPPPAESSANKPDPMALYRGQVNAAIQAATACSSAAKDMNLKGKTRVQFNLLDTIPSNPVVAITSGIPMLDNSALNAVKNARYPKPPTEFVGQTKPMSVLVNLNCAD